MINNGWKVFGIILMIVTIVLLIYTVAKMSYSVGYEDGQEGIINLIKMSKLTGSSISSLRESSNPEITKKIVYFILSPGKWK